MLVLVSVDFMSLHPDRLLTQLYGFHYISLMDIPLDTDGCLTAPAWRVMDDIFDIVTDADKCLGLTLKAFALRALRNMLTMPAGRSHFLDISEDSPNDPYMVREAGALWTVYVYVYD